MIWRRRDNPSKLATGPVNALRALESRVRPDFRKTVVFGVLALAGLIAGHGLGGIYAHSLRDRLAAWGCALVVVVFGVWASRTAGNEVDRIISARAGTSAGSTLRVVVVLVGYLIALSSVLDLLALPVHYFVGGTVVAIIIGVAAQQLLGNLFAGLVLLFARPYVPGERIRIRSGALGGPHEGLVTGVGLLYTTVRSAEGDINIPNSALLAAAVGPVADPSPDDPSPAGPSEDATGDAAQPPALGGAPGPQSA
jgi:small-conductance mechanosensitive channel